MTYLLDFIVDLLVIQATLFLCFHRDHQKIIKTFVDIFFFGLRLTATSTTSTRTTTLSISFCDSLTNSISETLIVIHTIPLKSNSVLQSRGEQKCNRLWCSRWEPQPFHISKMFPITTIVGWSISDVTKQCPVIVKNCKSMSVMLTS